MHASFDTVIKQISTQDNQKCSFDKKLKLPHQWKFKFGAVTGSKQNQMVSSAAGLTELTQYSTAQGPLIQD